MRRLNRSEKTRVIEKAKTLFIVLLFFLCLFLGYRIMRLYKEQANVESVLWGNPSSNAVYTENIDQYPLKLICEIPQPEIIVINDVQGRTQLDDKSEDFEIISSLTNQIIGELYNMKGDELSVSDKDEWENTLKTGSVYVKYPVERFLNFDRSLYEIRNNDILNKFASYTKVLLLPDNNDQSVTVFIAEQNNGRIVKAKLQSDTAKSICENAKKLKVNAQKEYVYACELNLDKPSSRDRVMLNSMLLIPAETEKAAEIKVTVPRGYKAGLNFTKATDLTVGLINIFGYNPNTIRQYVNSDDSIMFVGETGSLSLNPQGMIEYKALDAEDGVILDKTGGESFKNALFNLCGMFERIMRISGINTNNADFRIKMTSIPESYQPASKTEIGFDYFINGKRLEFTNSYGVWAVLQKGNLIELKLNLKSIESQSKQNPMNDMLTAIDEFCVQNEEFKKINDVYGVYKYKDDTEGLNAEWKVEGAK